MNTQTNWTGGDPVVRRIVEKLYATEPDPFPPAWMAAAASDARRYCDQRLIDAMLAAGEDPGDNQLWQQRKAQFAAAAEDAGLTILCTCCAFSGPHPRHEAPRAPLTRGEVLALAAHMRTVHGWTILDSEEDDLATLRAMHRAAMENNPGSCGPEWAGAR